MRARIVYVACLVMVLAGSAHAQKPAPPAVERHAKRLLALGNVSFVDSKKPTTTTGGLLQVSFKKWTVTRFIKPDSLMATLDAGLKAKLAPGPLDPSIGRPLRNDFFIRIRDTATVADSSGVWVLHNGPDRYVLGDAGGKLGVFTPIHVQTIRFPRAYLHLLASGSLNGEEDYAAFGQVGFMIRRASSMVTAVGLVAHGVMPAKGIGPVARAEVLDVLGIQGGPMWLDGAGWGVFVGVDFMKGLWKDIGLAP